ncbi:tetratricopeptide repeat protein [Fulvitalea axinellae]
MDTICLGFFVSKSGDPVKGRELLEGVLESHPKDGNIHCLFGIYIHMVEKRPEKAVTYFEYALSSDDCIWRKYAYQGLGEYLNGHKKYSEALELMDKALEEKETGEYYRIRAQSKGYMGDFEGALADDILALAKKCSSPRSVYLHEGDMLLALKRFPEAEAKFNRIPDWQFNAHLYVQKARLYYHLGNPILFSKWLDKAFEMPNPTAEAYEVRGIWHRSRGMLTESIEDLDRAIEMDPERPDPYYERGVSQYKANDFARAKTDLETAIRMKGTFPEAQSYLEDTDKALSGDGKAPIRYDNWKEAFKAKDYTTSLRLLDEALTHDPNNEEYYYHRSLCHKALGNYDAAIDNLRKDHFKPNGDDVYFHKLGALLVLAGKYEKAIDAYTEAKRLTPRPRKENIPEILSDRAQAFFRIGKRAEALTDITEAMEDPATKENEEVLSSAINIFLDEGLFELAHEKMPHWARQASIWQGRILIGYRDYDFAIRMLNDRHLHQPTKGQDSAEENQLIKSQIIVLGNLYLSLGQFEKAIRCYGQLATTFSEDPESHILLGEALYGADEYVKASESFRKAIDLGDKTGRGFLGAGRTKTALAKDLERVLDDFDNALSTDAENGDFHYFRSKALQALDKDTESIIALEKSVEVGNFSTETLYQVLNELSERKLNELYTKVVLENVRTLRHTGKVLPWVVRTGDDLSEDGPDNAYETEYLKLLTRVPEPKELTMDGAPEVHPKTMGPVTLRERREKLELFIAQKIANWEKGASPWGIIPVIGKLYISKKLDYCGANRLVAWLFTQVYKGEKDLVALRRLSEGLRRNNIFDLSIRLVRGKPSPKLSQKLLSRISAQERISSAFTLDLVAESIYRKTVRYPDEYGLFRMDVRTFPIYQRLGGLKAPEKETPRYVLRLYTGNEAVRSLRFECTPDTELSPADGRRLLFEYLEDSVRHGFDSDECRVYDWITEGIGDFSCFDKYFKFGEKVKVWENDTAFQLAVLKVMLTGDSNLDWRISEKLYLWADQDYHPSYSEIQKLIGNKIFIYWGVDAKQENPLDHAEYDEETYQTHQN